MIFTTKKCSCEVKQTQTRLYFLRHPVLLYLQYLHILQTHHLLMAYAESTIQFGEKVAHLDTFGVTKRKKEDRTAGDSPENAVSVSYYVESALRRITDNSSGKVPL